MSEWQIDLKGKPCRVTASRMPNGMIVIRAHGRVVGPPQPPENVDCWFSIEDLRLHLRSVGKVLQLDPAGIQRPMPPPLAARAVPPVTRDWFAIGRLQKQALAFIIAGVATFLLSTCYAVRAGSLYDRFQSLEVALIADGFHGDDPLIGNGYRIIAFMRRSLMLEALVGIALIAGGVALMRHERWASLALEITTWSVGGVAILGLALVDFLMHRQMHLGMEGYRWTPWVGSFHTAGVVILILISIGLGFLVRIVDQMNADVRAMRQGDAVSSSVERS